MDPAQVADAVARRDHLALDISPELAAVLRKLLADAETDRDCAVDLVAQFSARLRAAERRAATAELALLNLTARIDRADILRDEDDEFCAPGTWPHLAEVCL